MTNTRAGGIALATSTAGMVLIGLMHPSSIGHGVLGDEFSAMRMANAMLHALGFLLQAVVVFGFAEMVRERLAGSALARLGFACYAMGAFGAIIAASMSGFITPAYVEASLVPGGDPGIARAFAGLAVRLNQTFGYIEAILSSLAVLAWAMAWRGSDRFDVVLRGVGLVAGGAGLALAAWLAVTGARLDAHYFGIILLMHALWTGLVAARLLGDDPKAVDAPA